MTAQEFPYDIIVDHENTLLRIQVKATSKPTLASSVKRKTEVYKFGITRGTGDQYSKKRSYKTDEIDVLALVALDIKKIAYVKYDKTIRSMYFRVPGLQYTNRNRKEYHLFENYTFESVINDFCRQQDN